MLRAFGGPEEAKESAIKIIALKGMKEKFNIFLKKKTTKGKGIKGLKKKKKEKQKRKARNRKIIDQSADTMQLIMLRALEGPKKQKKVQLK